jgi:hypothetical protein
MRWFRVKSVIQAKKLAYKLGPGSECWRSTNTIARKDEPFLARTFSNTFEFEVV